MSVKKYGFSKILKEYNKNKGQDCRTLSSIADATVLYNNGNNIATVVFRDLALIRISPVKQSLVDFLHYNVTPCPSLPAIMRVIQNISNKNLDLEIKILPSNKIRYAYLQANSFAKAGPLGSSCMRHKENQKSLNFYIKNNAKIVVVIDKKGKIHARALLWEGVKSTELKKTFTYLDRVYYVSENLLLLFQNLAQENKWKSYNSTSAGRAKQNYYIDNINIMGICHLPYTDTFRFLYYKDNLISASTQSNIQMLVKHRDCCVSLTNTGDGGYQPAIDADRVREVLTGNFISKKDAIKVKRYGGYVLKKHIADIDGDYYSSRDDVVAKSELDGFMLKENSVNEVLTNNTINKTKAIHSPKYNGHIHKSNAIYIKGELYHTKDTNITCFKSKWYHISDCFRNYDRQKRNEELEKQQYRFWIPLNEYFLPVYMPYPDSMPIPKDGLIPKEHAIIAYDLIYNSTIDNIEYQEVYCTSKVGLVQLVTGELVINTLENKKYIKKFNNKWYIKQEFKLGDTTVSPNNTPATFRTPNKNQSSFDFTEKK